MNRDDDIPGDSADERELPFQKEWADMVRRARAEKRWSQAELARRVGVEQAMISYIENYTVKSSKAVRRLVEQLDIPMPRQYFDDDLEERWVETGRVLRRINEAGFMGLLHGAEMMIANAKTSPDEH